MNPLDITRSYINETAKKYGFQRDTLEKVVRLYYVLKDISDKQIFKGNLALKGGTAINLAYFDLPRLSVDIDMDFTKSGKMEELRPIRKEIKETLFDLLQSQGYTIGKLGKELHTLDQWTFNYQSVAGNNDHIKIELNYGIRNHVLPVTDKRVKLDIVTDTGIEIPTLHPCELFATKINALIERAAVRDLFDVYSLSKSDTFSSPEKKEALKKCILFYQTIGIEGSAKRDIDLSKIMEVQPSKIKSQLMPLLPSGKKFFPIEIAKESTMQYLKSVLTLSPKEQEYLECFSKGFYKPELLFSDKAIIERVADHPMAKWKIAQFKGNEFFEAIKKNDYPKLISLKAEGFSPSPEAINKLNESAPRQTIIAVQKIFDLPTEPVLLENIKLAQSEKGKLEINKNNNLNI